MNVDTLQSWNDAREKFDAPAARGPRELSKRQGDMLEAIANYRDRREYSPSIRDIQAMCHISSTSVVDYNLRALARLGLITRAATIGRTTVVTKAGYELLGRA